MTQEQIIALAQIYNSLMCIETKGENTILMGKCLLKLQTLIQELQNNIIEKGENKQNGN